MLSWARMKKLRNAPNVMTQIEGYVEHYVAKQRELTLYFMVTLMQTFRLVQLCSAFNASMRQGSLTATNGQKLMPNLRFDCTWHSDESSREIDGDSH